MKKIISILLAITIILTTLIVLPMSVYAEIYSGICGNNLTWSLDTNTGVLTISGTGDMYAYNYSSLCGTTAPWGMHSSYIKTVEFGKGVTRIGEYAFSGCDSLTSVEIPNSVTYIDADAFFCCLSLTSVEIPNSVTSIGWDAFYSCTSLTSVEIPNSVTKIGYGTFGDCTSLTSVEIPNSVKSIGDWAFGNCTSLTSVEIPNSVKSIEDWAFGNCTSLIEINVSKDNKNYKSIDGNLYTIDETVLMQYVIGKTDASFIIPNSVTSIRDGAFFGCKSLTSVEIPNSVTNIGSQAFDYCRSLTSVKISDIAAWCNIDFDYGANPLYCAKELYLNNELITDLVIPDTVTEIKSYAFYSCTSLTSVEIPNSVTKIGNWAFEDCTRLTSVKIGNGVTNIGNLAFSGCTSLTDVYYNGIRCDWDKMEISVGNECLTRANIHFIDKVKIDNLPEDVILKGYSNGKIYIAYYDKDNLLTQIDTYTPVETITAILPTEYKYAKIMWLDNALHPACKLQRIYK